MSIDAFIERFKPSQDVKYNESVDLFASSTKYNYRNLNEVATLNAKLIG